MATLEKLLNEYKAVIKPIEFGDRTPEQWDAYDQWQKANAHKFFEYGLHPLDVFDELWEELDQLFNPRPERSKVVEEWQKENSAKLMEKGYYTNEVIFCGIDELREAYQFGGNQELTEALNKLASVPLMTTEVLQELIYESCRNLPASMITGLNKVKIPVPN
jgi:hypothetical protein